MNANGFNPLLTDTASAIAAGDRELAQQEIESVMPENTDCPTAWLMRAFTSESMSECETAISRALDLDPNNETAIAGLNWFHGIQALAEWQIGAARQAEEAARQAELERQAELKRQAEEEAARQAELERQAELKRQAEEEAARQAELERQAELKRQAEEEAARQAELERQAEEAARQAELERQAEESARLAELERQAELQRQAEEAARLAELERQAEIQRQAAEAARQAELERQAQTEQLAESKTDEELDRLQQEVETLAGEVQQEVEMPTAVAESNQSGKPVSGEERSSSQSLILAVDDSPTVRKLVSLTLGANGFEVLTAADGIEALNILSDTLPDLILCDINMPRLGGYKLCKFVKKHERTQSIPVVMLSGKDGVFDKMRGKLSGCDDFISKPFESEELVAKIREHLEVKVSSND